MVVAREEGGAVGVALVESGWVGVLVLSVVRWMGRGGVYLDAIVNGGGGMGFCAKVCGYRAMRLGVPFMLSESEHRRGFFCVRAGDSFQLLWLLRLDLLVTLCLDRNCL